MIRACLRQQGARQIYNLGYVRATALLADLRLAPEYWSYVCRWVAYVDTHRVVQLPINKTPLPYFGDVAVRSSTTWPLRIRGL